jgi:hypothetical protein
MPGLTVLITNWTLGLRGGSVLYTRDLALELLAQGHRPVVFSPEPGDVANELRAATVPVIDDLKGLARAPDVIHGNHHPELMLALLRYPCVPALHVCHAWATWDAAPPRFPRVQRYVAVDDTCRDWLICEQGIAPEQTQVVYNAVDLGRFEMRPPLPARPQRALVFSNYATEHSYLAAVRQACTSAGLSLDVVGAGVGNCCAQPEAILGNYDLVFAKARCALEALAVGTAVVLCDSLGCGPLVTRQNWESLRRLNFGRRALRAPVHPDTLVRAIAGYDAADAAEVCHAIRGCAGLDLAVARLVETYRAIVAERGQAGPVTRAAELVATTAYLQWLLPRAKLAAVAEADRHRLQAEAAQQQALCEQLQSDLSCASLRHTQQLAQSEAALAQTEAALAQSEAMLATQRSQLADQAAQAQRHIDHLQQRCADFAGDCTALRDRLRQSEQECHALHTALAALTGSRTMRLRQRLLRFPVLGRSLRVAARLVAGGFHQETLEYARHE